MYLSKLLFDPLKRQVRKELANRYELHRTLYAQFDGINKSDVGLLYRVEMGNPNQMEPILMLVQTQVEPDWQAMFEQGLLVENAAVKQDSIFSKQSKKNTEKKNTLTYDTLTTENF